MTTLEFLHAKLKEVRDERYRAGEAAFYAVPGSAGIRGYDPETADRVDRIYAPRIERLERLIKEARERSDQGKPDPFVQAPAPILVQEGFSPGKREEKR